MIQMSQCREPEGRVQTAQYQHQDNQRPFAMLDRIKQFCYAKQKNVQTAKNAPDVAGDVWTWVALDADTKLVPSWLVAGRDLGSAYTFMHDLADRITSRVQLTTRRVSHLPGSG